MAVAPRTMIVAHATRLNIDSFPRTENRPRSRRLVLWRRADKLCATSDIAERQLVTGVGRGSSAECLPTRQMRSLWALDPIPQCQSVEPIFAGCVHWSYSASGRGLREIRYRRAH